MSKRLGLNALVLATLLAVAGAMAQKPELSGEVALNPSELVQYEISWQTVLPSLGRVEYGPDTSYGSVTQEVPALEGEHTHLLSGLLPDTTYHYRVITRDWEGNETVTEGGTFVAARGPEAQLAQVGAAAPGASSAANVLVDDTFENGLDESVWTVYNNTESGELTVEDAQLIMRDVGDGSNYGQVGLALQTPLDLTSAPTTITVRYSETGNTEQNPGFWNVADLSGDDNWNHPGFRATVTADGVSPTSTPPAEGVWTPAEGAEAQAPYTLTWTITPPEGEGDFSSTMQIDGEEVYSGTFTPGSFDPEEAYFYLYVSTPNEEGTTAIDAVTVEQAGAEGGAPVAAITPVFDPSGETAYQVLERNLFSSDVAELGDATSISLEENATVQMEPYAGADDLSGDVWLGWDEANLYLTARVQDDVHAQEFTGGDVWQGDSLQLALAAGAPDEDAEWYEYGFSLTEDGPQVWRWLAPEDTETGAVDAAQLEVTRDDDAQTTVYAAALPWAELTPITPEPGLTYSFSFIANDNDGDGRKGWLELGSGVGGDKDPSLFVPFEFVAATAPAAQQAAALPDGLVAAWLFDDGEGETVADALGAHDGTFTNPQWAQGQFGGAAQIAPGENYISLSGEGLSPADALTVTAWVYLNAYGEGEFPNRRVLQLGSYDPDSQYGIEDNAYRLLFEFGEFIFDAGPGPEPRQLSVPQDAHIALETWHHVAGVYSGDVLTLYVDGEEVAREELDGAALTAPAESRLFIGTKSDLAPEGDWWDGLIDEVAIFDRALSQNDVRTVMQGLAGGTSGASTSGAAAAAPQETSQEPTGEPAIVRADMPITVDGDLSDWAGLGGVLQVDASMVADAEDVTDDNDLSLTAQLAYNDNWVYFSADVTDDTLIFERTGDAIWQTDSVEFWLGAQQFGATISGRDAQPYLHSWGGLDLSEAEVAVVTHEGGYMVEAAFPRAVLEEALETSFEAGSSLPVAVGANDADEEGGERTGQIYFPEGWTWGEPESFEELELTP